MLVLFSQLRCLHVKFAPVGIDIDKVNMRTYINSKDIKGVWSKIILHIFKTISAYVYEYVAFRFALPYI